MQSKLCVNSPAQAALADPWVTFCSVSTVTLSTAEHRDFEGVKHDFTPYPTSSPFPSLLQLSRVVPISHRQLLSCAAQEHLHPAKGRPWFLLASKRSSLSGLQWTLEEAGSVPCMSARGSIKNKQKALRTVGMGTSPKKSNDGDSKCCRTGFKSLRAPAGEQISSLGPSFDLYLQVLWLFSFLQLFSPALGFLGGSAVALANMWRLGILFSAM